MADEVIRRSGSAADHGSFTGASGEWTHDTTLKAIRVHDGSQAGGYPIFHEGYVEEAPDGGTDAFSADARRPVSAGETVRVDITSANTTTTPTFENTQGTPSGALTITTRDGSALWAGALSGVHELQLASGGGSWLVLDPNPNGGDEPASVAETLAAATGSSDPGLAFDTWRTPNADRETFVLARTAVSTDGSSSGFVDFEVDESGGTTPDYTMRVNASSSLPSGTFILSTPSTYIPAGGSYRIANTQDPNGNNELTFVREFTR